jgi:hypothetical protein
MDRALVPRGAWVSLEPRDPGPDHRCDRALLGVWPRYPSWEGFPGDTVLEGKRTRLYFPLITGSSA